jgi:plastocyanin/uncharacterized membrane protein YozB (DUF420 family)
MLKGAGFLGTGASFGADLTLVVQTLFFIVLTIGVVAQLLRKHKAHDFLQTPVVILNFFFIIFLMVTSFAEQQVARELVGQGISAFYLLPFTHACLGILAQGLATYVLLAGWKILPRKIGTLRYFMWATYVVWAIAALYGLGTYINWYVLNANRPVEITQVDFEETSTETGQPAVQRALLQNFSFVPGELTVAAGTTVAWINQDGAPHNVTFVDGSVASDNFRQGEAFEHTFDEPGVFPLYCTLHGNESSGMIGTVTVVEATEENVTQLAEQAVVELVPPEPTPAPPVPLAPPALIEPPTPEDTVVGVLAFRDNVSPGDSVTLAMGGVEAAPAGSVLQAWLIGENNAALDIGRVEPDGRGNLSFTYTDPSRQNLMALYDGVQISTEPVNDTDPKPGPLAYSGRQAPNANAQIRLITAGAEETPSKVGYGIGARLQAEELIRHSQYLQLAYDLGSIADAQRHTEHILNILEREGGEFFGDWSGAHGTQNPGDGFGLIPYIRHTQEAAQAASASDDATNAVQVHARHVVLATDNALEWATSIREAAFGIIDAGSIGDVGPQVDTINRLSLLLLLGEDTNGDGGVAPDEGGIFTAYQHAQYMGAVGVIAGDAAGVVEPLTAPGIETQIAAGEIVIDMVDFEYGLKTVTVPAGTKVRFVNQGQARHSATADDGSFDSGLLDPGQEFTITLDEPGLFPYYCVLHGTRGGVGMAASITVVEAGAEVPDLPTPEPTPQPEGEPTEAAPAEPTAEPAEAPEAAGEFLIDMLDFTYSDLNPVIPAGSTVAWVNAGGVKHSATADDGSWDTTLLGPGGEASISFDEPGAYAYYCTLHGSPGGIGMSATITVSE